MLETLLGHTPDLAGGYAINLLISALSMLAGTVVGVFLGFLRGARWRITSSIAALLTNLCRNVPSFVLLFYLAFMLPVEIDWNGQIILLPPWIKATLALTFPVVGFASDQFLGYQRQSREGHLHADLVFLSAWVQYALIILMASATASVIGTDEILSRANRIAGSVSDTSFLVLIYAYVSLWFLATGLILTWIAGQLSRRGAAASQNVRARA